MAHGSDDYLFIILCVKLCLLLESDISILTSFCQGFCSAFCLALRQCSSIHYCSDCVKLYLL